MRVALSFLAIAACVFLIQASARFGLSRAYSRYALLTNSVPAADDATRITPSDPEAHRTRATVFSRRLFPEEAAKSLERACSLRYRDDYLWIELGNTKEELGDTEAALAAMDQAVKWAPHYAHPHWQRGNLLLRMGQSTDAFNELRNAATTNPAYEPNLIDLAWGISRGDVKTAETLGGIDDDRKRLAFIRFLAQKGKGAEIVDQLRKLTTAPSDAVRSDLARALFAAGAYTEAHAISFASDSHEAAIINPGFEEPLVFNDIGFGWIIASDHRGRLAIDVAEKQSGSKSLQINLDGSWLPGTPLVSQTILVSPAKTYRLSFAVKTKDLVTGGPPVFLVIDAKTQQVLAKSENLPTATSDWSKLSFNFTSLPTSQAVVIRLTRNNCDSSPCPIFGTLWLDEFLIEQTENTTKR